MPYDHSSLPDFDSLPAVSGMPQGCAWGVFDKDGKKDLYGTLNLLTPSVVKEAATEIQTGTSVSLNWPIGAINAPGFSRKGLRHKVISLYDIPGIDLHGYDDEVEFNTQCSSQWDSCCHFNHQPTATGYNGAKLSVDALTQEFGKEDKTGELPTLHHWHARGGVVGRGVLIDYKAYADAKGIKYDPFTDHTITTKDIEDVAAHQGVTFKQGDILIIRMAFTEVLSPMNEDEQAKAFSSHRYCGVEGTAESAKWFWNKHFAAVAGDMIAFEPIPPKVDGKDGQIKDLVLHSWFLAMFGMPIGELWDLKRLSEECARQKRYSFFLTSVPLYVPGGIGSPPNALAVF